MKKRFLALILALSMVLSMVTVNAAAAEPTGTAEKDKYVTLDGDWHFKLYRKYSQMYQYFPYNMVSIVWENSNLAKVPSEATFSQWETFQMPADDEVTGGLLPQSRPVVEEVPAAQSLSEEVEQEDLLEIIAEVVEEPEAPAEETPAEEPEAPAEETPAEETEAPAEETPAEEPEAPAEETPTEEPEAPAEETPAEETEAPAEEPEEEEPEEPAEFGTYNSTWLFPVWSEAWVCRTFDVPADFTEDETVTLILGTIDDVDVVYINGKPVASSGFMDAAGSPTLNDNPLGGFDYATKNARFEKSYWEIGREYKIPTSAIKEGKNTIQIRVYNNNSLGGFYSNKIYALCGNQAAVRNLKGLSTERTENDVFLKTVADQIAAIEANDMEAYAATIAPNFSDNGKTAEEYIAEMTALLKDHTDIKVTDTDAGYFKGDNVYNYTAKRTISSAEGVICSGEIELSYLESGEKVLERGNWSRCYTTSYTSDLFNGENLTYSVYLPPSYYTNPDKEYPVVYLLHGQNSSSTSYINVDGIAGFMDNLINSGKVIDMVVVMPDSGKNAFYRDSAIREDDPNHNDSGPWATQLVSELRLEVEKNYRTMNAPEFRGLTGNSMGGGGSFALGCAHPELFSSVASHMGYLPSANTAALEALTDEQLAKYDFYLDCGLQDTTVGTGNTIRVHEYLLSRGKEHGYELRDGIHGSAFYMGSMDKSMMMHSAHFQKNMAPTEPEEPAEKTENTITASNVTKSSSVKKQTFALGAKAVEGKLTYSCSSSKVVVDKNGKVTIAPKFIGKATITIKSAETDTLTAATKKVTVTVNPAKTSLVSLKSSKKGKLTIKWKKTTSCTARYKVQYSTSKDFSKGVKTFTARRALTSKTISGLKSGKTYYVRIRTYKILSGKTYSSAWSSVKSAKVK